MPSKRKIKRYKGRKMQGKRRRNNGRKHFISGSRSIVRGRRQSRRRKISVGRLC